MSEDRHPATEIASSAPPPAWAERLVRFMDDGFRVPGTKLRFGFDSLLGLLPVGGDAAGVITTLSLFYVAVQRQVPREVLVRMALNVALDGLLGSVPIVGDVFDLVWKANRQNLTLIERNPGGPGAPKRGLARLKDRLLLGVILLLVLTALLLPFVLLGVLFGYVLRR